VYRMSPREFSQDVHRAKAVLEAAGGVPVYGYRAPSYSIISESLWALDVLIDEGHVYDASVYPIRHDRYGIPQSPRHPYLVERPGGVIWELPGSTVRRAGQNLPIGGGGYFRLLPYAWTRRGIAEVNTVERQPVTFYLHPWEIDPEQPRVAAVPLLSRIRHYRNLAKTEDRLRRLLSEFRFGPAISVLGGEGLAIAPPARVAAFA
jgi:polysaccharide deacetylase family protein (PEP-CTERM system associated)